MNCEQVEERLSAYLDNMLTPEERREITVHLHTCSQCMRSLAELRQNDALLAQLPRVSPHAALHERLFSSPEIWQLQETQQSRWVVTDDRVRLFAASHRTRRSVVALPNGRSTGLYRCTQRHSLSHMQRRAIGLSNLSSLSEQ